MVNVSAHTKEIVKGITKSVVRSQLGATSQFCIYDQAQQQVGCRWGRNGVSEMLTCKLDGTCVGSLNKLASSFLRRNSTLALTVVET